MSREILEKAFEKTKQNEEKERKQMRIAKALGEVGGSIAALALDATVIWAILVYLVGVPVSWLAIFGGMLLFQIVKFKVTQ